MPRINSLNYLREVSEGQWAVKLFSRHEMRHEELEDIFGAYNVLWTHRKQWFSYPLVMPLSPDEFAPLQLDDGLYYTSPMGMPLLFPVP